MATSTPDRSTDAVSLTIKVPKEVKDRMQMYADADLRSISKWLTVHIMSLERSKSSTTAVQTTTTDGETTAIDVPWESNW